jgi:hypothetical protein
MIPGHVYKLQKTKNIFHGICNPTSIFKNVYKLSGASSAHVTKTYQSEEVASQERDNE